MKFIVIDNFHEALENSLTKAGHECVNMVRSSDDDILKAVKTADGVLLRSRIAIRKELIDQCPHLKIIGRVGAGLEHIDVEYAKLKGIDVLSSPEGNRQAVAEHALAMILGLFNKIPKANEEVRRGIWDRSGNEGIELAGKTIGIIGFGNTGSAFAKVVSCFGVKILAYDKYKSNFEFESSMEQVWKEADIVSIHLPLSNETKNLVNSNWINQFSNPVYIINTSRGKILNTADLLDAIDQGKVSGACLDVLEYEAENLIMPSLNALPESAKRLMQSDKVILTPHVAGITVQSFEKLSMVLAEKILKLVN